MELANITKKLALSTSQAQIYSPLLQLGSATIQEIVVKSGVKRTTVYAALDSLVERGLVTYFQKGSHRIYAAENPNKLIHLFDEDIIKIEQKRNDIRSLLPELMSLYNAHVSKPKIRTYEGLEGIKKIFEESLELNRGEETLVYSAYEEVTMHMNEYIKNYIHRRAAAGITQRCLAEYSQESVALKSQDGSDLRQTRLLPSEKFPFTNQINIFGNKVFIASYKDLIGIILESEEIAKTQRSIFELAWLGAENQQL
jgi:sugar-specific transcriptional regulator TrmB